MLSHIRELLSMNPSQPPVTEFMESGLCPMVMQFFTPKGRLMGVEFLSEATWILANACMGTAEQQAKLLELNILSIFNDFLQAATVDMAILENCLWSLCNIIGSNLDYRDLVLKHPIADSVFKIMEKSQLFGKKIWTQLAWFVSNLVRGRPHPPKHEIEKFVGMICQMYLNYSEDEFDEECTYAIAEYLNPSSEKDIRISNIVESGVTKKVKSALDNSDTTLRVLKACLRTIGNITSGPNEFIYDVLDAALAYNLVKMTKNKHVLLALDALWCISNCLAGTQANIDMICTEDLFPNLLLCILNGGIATQREAMICLNNFVQSAMVHKVEGMLSNCPEVGVSKGIDFPGVDELYSRH